MNLQVRELKQIIPPLPWEPTVGEETRAFVERKNEKAGIPYSALETIVYEAQQILGRCVDPHGPARGTTGLVVGFVQSGKTLSFTTLSALAHDNGFGLVILIAGTKDNLREQTRLRLLEDLRIGGTAVRPWVPLTNPKPGSGDATLLGNNLSNFSNASTPPHRKRVCIVMVLKQHQRLANLYACLKAMDLSKVPTLVIDDEADQASPNTFAARNSVTGANRRSANYREITQLKSALPHHTYVQYTATPQATLLSSLEDALSPEFAELVSPGDAYVGGAALFAPRSPYVVSIPDSDAAAGGTATVGPPATLVKALRTYLLGACAAEAKHQRLIRTMMVHPSQQTGLHKDYLRWLEDLIAAWRAMLEEDALKATLCASFSSEYDELAATVHDLPPLEILLPHLSQVLRIVTVRDVNSTESGKTPIDWSACEYWILIGGAKLDRGFTVEGLTVTYMPRPIGDGNADSIQQRARFCGYKRGYLGYCRVFLQRGVRHAFEQYVEHEQDIHRSLTRTRGYPLKHWVRAFILDASMQPTRRNVIGLPLKEFAADGWIAPAAAHRSKNLTGNQAALNAFVALLRQQFKGERADAAYPERYIDRRASSARNILYEGVPAQIVIDELLRPLSLLDSEDQYLTASAIVALQKALGDDRIDEGQKLVDVFEIGEIKPQVRSRRAGDYINQVFSGRSPSRTTDRAQLNYGGDRDFSSDARITFHVRTFDIAAAAGLPEVIGVPWFAMHVPASLKVRLLLQTD